MSTLEEIKNALYNGTKGFIGAAPEEARALELRQIIEQWGLVDKMYQPDDALKLRLRQYQTWCEAKGKTDEDPGKLMEEIALLAMRCLNGYDSIRSYQSYTAQIDLLVSGSTPDWVMLMTYLHLDVKYRSIVVEAKNLSKQVDDKQFSRLCYHLQNTFTNTAQLGVFFTRLGATGFPSANGKGRKMSRLRKLENAQATQIIFHARTSKFIIVLDHNDILRLGEPGYLPCIFEAKIREVEQWSGLETTLIEQIDLPPHLAKYF